MLRKNLTGGINMIKIYGPKLGSAFRCHVLMLEMGIEFEEAKVDFQKGDQ